MASHIDRGRPLRTLTEVARANITRLSTDPSLTHDADRGITGRETEMPREVATALSTCASYSELITCGDWAIQHKYYEAARRAFAAAGAVERLLALAELCVQRRCRSIGRRALESILEGTARA